MITFSKFGKYGNLGNQLHQLATLIGFSEKYQCEFVLPPWKYSDNFINPPIQKIVETDFLVEEPFYHYTPDFWDLFAIDFRFKTVDILGWLQSEKYWLHCKDKVIDALKFRDNIYALVKTKYAEALSKSTIAISIRRGDFITDPNFYLLPLEYYLQALKRCFPNYKDYNIIIFTDDFNYCKINIRHLPNIFFASHLDAIGQLCLMSLCDHFIISNSTFSWWGAMLGEKKHSVIIRSPYQIAGELLKKFDNKDYYPDRWHVFDHVGKIDKLSDLINPGYYIKLSEMKKQAYTFIKKLVR